MPENTVSYKKIIDFVEKLVEDQYRFDSQQLKGFSREEIGELVAMIILRVESREKMLKDVVNNLEQKIHQRTQELMEKNRNLEELATHDQLTGLYNRRYFDEKLKEYSLLAERTGQPLSCIMADIDHFKVCNDTHGHQAGDLVLQNIARILQDNTRTTDICARYGGEEFVMLLPNTKISSALKLSEKHRSIIEEMELGYDGKKIKVTTSFGATWGNKISELGETLVKRADFALYRAKQGGRNKVCGEEG